MARGQGRVDPPIECIDCTKWAQCSRSNETIAFRAAASADVNDRLNGMYKEIVSKAFMCQLFCTIGLLKRQDSAVYMYISCIWNLLFCLSLPVFWRRRAEKQQTNGERLKSWAVNVAEVENACRALGRLNVGSFNVRVRFCFFSKPKGMEAITVCTRRRSFLMSSE